VDFSGQSSVELAERYFAAVDATCRRLADHLRSGFVYDSGIARLKGLRRVHGARDSDNVFAQEEA
jgi:plasmid stabilization system protein ParE